VVSGFSRLALLANWDWRPVQGRQRPLGGIGLTRPCQRTRSGAQLLRAQAHIHADADVRLQLRLHTF
jgi:hypothetical protein